MVKITNESDSAMKTIDILQAMITRMSGASGSCKNWCITIISAAAIFAADKSQPMFAIIALLPTTMLCALDVYYLTVERLTRLKYETLTDRLRNETATVEELFDVRIDRMSFKNTWDAFLSTSIWPFYVPIALALLVVAMFTKSR